MRIGVISDTHLVKPTEALYRVNKDIFADVSLVLHAGDLTRLAILEAFSDKEVIAVAGNMDRSDVTARLATKEIIDIDGFRIGLIHGWGSPKGLEDKIIDSFQGVHAIVYGHTHTASNHMKNGVLMFNPGAFSGTLLLGRNRSVGILTLNNGIKGTIIKI
ncbi:MAG: metallophosphatase family protein [Proteobacteria bacterium]|nr:metallophosphatase family protein [Pseudomonadota bacterium]